MPKEENRKNLKKNKPPKMKKMKLKRELLKLKLGTKSKKALACILHDRKKVLFFLQISPNIRR